MSYRNITHQVREYLGQGRLSEALRTLQSLPLENPSLVSDCLALDQKIAHWERGCALQRLDAATRAQEFCQLGESIIFALNEAEASLPELLEKECCAQMETKLCYEEYDAVIELFSGFHNHASPYYLSAYHHFCLATFATSTDMSGLQEALFHFNALERLLLAQQVYDFELGTSLLYNLAAIYESIGWPEMAASARQKLSLLCNALADYQA